MIAHLQFGLMNASVQNVCIILLWCFTVFVLERVLLPQPADSSLFG